MSSRSAVAMVLATMVSACGGGCGSQRTVGLADAGRTDVSAAPESSDNAPFPPPDPAPPDAQPLAHEGRWKLTTPGAGAPPGPSDTLVAHLTVWRSDGTVVFGGRTGPGWGTTRFPFRRVPTDLVPVFSKVPPGGVAQLWLPRALVQAANSEGRLPQHMFPVDDLVVRYELITFESHPENPATEAPAAVEAGQRLTAAIAPASSRVAPSVNPYAPPPDAAGPPANAVVAVSGTRYTVLHAASDGDAARPDSRVDASIALYAVHGLTVDGPTQRTVATTPARAPAGLSRLLLGAHAGDAFRIWLSESRAKEAFPGVAGGESVCDLTVDAVGAR